LKPSLRLSLKRIAAFGIDYCIIAAYGGFLFYVSLQLDNVFHLFEWFANQPVRAQVIGFLTLTFPVFLFFVLFERSLWQATPGKLILKLKVVSAEYGKAPLYCLAIRNGIKFIPWEVAHGAVHWSFYYVNQGSDIPFFLILINGAAMTLALLYVVLIFIRSDNRTLYETWSGTRVITVNQANTENESEINP